MTKWPAVTDQTALFAVGSYTNAYGQFRAQGDGLSLLSLSSDGTLTLLDYVALPNPAYVIARTDGTGFLTVLEVNDDQAGVATIAYTRGTLGLNDVQTTLLPGAIPCHLCLHPDGQWLAVARYGAGTIGVRAISPSGQVRADRGVDLSRSGSGPHHVRQTASHPHGSVFSPDGKWLCVPDLGTDQVALYPFDPATGMLGPVRHWCGPEGSGPRVVLFDRRGENMLLVSELSSEISLLAWHDGALEELHRLSARDGTGAPDNTTSGLRWHPDGWHFGVTNRGDHTVTLLRAEAGRLHLVATQPTGAKPRDLGFSPCGCWLLTACQDSDRIEVFRIDATNRMQLTPAGAIHVRSPSCIAFLPEHHQL